jgi:hypothetical protein
VGGAACLRPGVGCFVVWVEDEWGAVGNAGCACACAVLVSTSCPSVSTSCPSDHDVLMSASVALPATLSSSASSTSVVGGAVFFGVSAGAPTFITSALIMWHVRTEAAAVRTWPSVVAFSPTRCFGAAVVVSALSSVALPGHCGGCVHWGLGSVWVNTGSIGTVSGEKSESMSASESSTIPSSSASAVGSAPNSGKIDPSGPTGFGGDGEVRGGVGAGGGGGGGVLFMLRCGSDAIRVAIGKNVVIVKGLVG